MKRSPNARLLEAVTSKPLAEQDDIAKATAALQAGADPNMASREFQNFNSLIGMASRRASPGLVAALLNAGASVHWPEDDIPPEDLTGEEDANYAGGPVDPLGICLFELGNALGEYRTPGNDAYHQIIANRVDIATRLVAAGASYTRPDPATCVCPLEALIHEFSEANPPEHLPSLVLATLGSLIFDAVSREGPGAVEHLALEQWKGTPLPSWQWHEDYPDLVRDLVGRAQQHQLQETTPHASPSRAIRL